MMKISAFYRRFCAGEYTFHHVLGEAWETLVALAGYGDVREEAQDTLIALQLWVYERTQLDWEMVISQRAMRKARNRRAEWELIFRREGLTFDPKWLRNGSNYKKPEKVKLAIELARRSHATRG